ncbi:MAG: hypothetical protein ACJ77K_17590 [Bacteroidia bacterium]
MSRKKNKRKVNNRPEKHEILPTNSKMEEIFDDKFLSALSDWQRGWAEDQDRRRIIADELLKQCEKLPEKFKIFKKACYRKRFIIEGEAVPIILNDNFYEGIASWTTNPDCAMQFKGIVKIGTTFTILFKHKPSKEEIVVNINLLWKNKNFRNAVSRFQKEKPEEAKPLLNFRDYQSEIILRSTLKATEIENIVGVSSSFEELCDMAEIPEKDREELSVKYAKNLDGIPIGMPSFLGSNRTKKAVQKVISDAKKMISLAQENGVPINWSRVALPHGDDLKHKTN